MGDGGAETPKGHARQPGDEPQQKDDPLLFGRSKERGGCCHGLEPGPLGGSLARQAEPGPPREGPYGWSWNQGGDAAAAEAAVHGQERRADAPDPPFPSSSSLHLVAPTGHIHPETRDIIDVQYFLEPWHTQVLEGVC